MPHMTHRPHLRDITSLWLLAGLLVTLLGCTPTAQMQPTVGERLAHAVLYNATGETTSVWTLEAEHACLICPDDPLLPGASRRLALVPGPVTWEIVAVPYGDFATGYRLPTVTAVIAPDGITNIILSGHVPEP